MDSTSTSILNLRRQIDVAFSDWYKQKQEMYEFIEGYKSEDYYMEMRKLARTYDQGHFYSKKRKVDFILPSSK